MKRIAWKYLAGFIDGEGCIDFQIIRRKNICPRVRVALADDSRFLLESLQNTYGGLLTERPSKNENWQSSTSWELVGYRQVCKFLRSLTKHLILKKEQARFVLWMETHIKGKQVGTEVRDACREELKLMKRDPHRLSETAQGNILAILQSSNLR
jgi:hypothetical protein